MSIRTLSFVLSFMAIAAQVTPPCSQYDPTKKVSSNIPRTRTETVKGNFSGKKFRFPMLPFSI